MVRKPPDWPPPLAARCPRPSWQARQTTRTTPRHPHPNHPAKKPLPKFPTCSISTPALFSRKPPTPGPSQLLSRVLWVIAHVQGFLFGRPRNTPKTPTTTEEALAWLQHMLQAINDFAASAKAGTLEPWVPPAPTQSTAPPAGPSPRPQRCPAAALPSAIAAPQPPDPAPETAPAPRPPARPVRRPRYNYQRHSGAPQRQTPAPTTPATRGRAFFSPKKINHFRPRPNHAQIVPDT
jgi:hypothetical protein